MPQPSQTLQAAQAKQLEARRKMQSLPSRLPRTELSNVNWHDQYLKRVAK